MNHPAPLAPTSPVEPRPLAPVRQSRYELASSSGMFTHLQLKPRVALSLSFTGWSGWLREHAIPHAALIREHATGFVPVGFEIEYLHPVTFFDCDLLAVTTRVTTRNPPSFPTIQDVAVTIATGDGLPVARVAIQEIGVHIESQDTLAAEPARVPGEVATLLHGETASVQGLPHLLNRPARHVPPEVDPIDGYEHGFTVHRHACEAADLWYAEHVADYIGASRESMVFTRSRRFPALLPGLAARLERVAIGLRQPYQFLDEGRVVTSAYRVDRELRFVHQLRTPSGEDAGDAVEVFAVS